MRRELFRIAAALKGMGLTTVMTAERINEYGEMRRGLTVLKMRGSMHDKDIRELTCLRLIIYSKRQKPD